MRAQHANKHEVEICKTSYVVNKGEEASSALHRTGEAVKENDTAHGNSHIGSSAAQRPDLNVAVQKRRPVHSILRNHKNARRQVLLGPRPQKRDK